MARRVIPSVQRAQLAVVATSAKSPDATATLQKTQRSSLTPLTVARNDRGLQPRRSTLTSSGLIRSGTVQPFRSYSAMQDAAKSFQRSASPEASAPNNA